MSDQTELLEAIDAAEDAFSYAHGKPTFEPAVNARPDAADGEVQIQKACRLLELTHGIDKLGAYYGAILEHSFIVIEHTLQGYLLVMTGAEAEELRDHTRPYEFSKGQVPLNDKTIESLQALHSGRRTEHYYGTTVTTETQAKTMRTVAASVHEHVVGFDHEIEQHCVCPS